MKRIFAIFNLFVLMFTFVFANSFPAYADSELSEPTLATEQESEDDFFLEDPPPMWSFTLENLVELKLAYEILPDKLFECYIDYNDLYDGSEIYDKESAKRVIDILESTTIVLIDGNPESFSEMLLYVEDAWVSATIIIEEDERFIHYWYYSPYLYGDKTVGSSDNPNFVKEITNGDVTAQVLCIDGYYWSKMSVNGTFIKTRELSSTDEQELKLKEFEADFARFEFVKIGDLLEDTYSVDSIEESGEVLINTVSLIASLLKNIINAFGEYVRINNGFFIY